MVVKFGLVVSWLSRVSAWLGGLNRAWASGSGRRGGCPKSGGGDNETGLVNDFVGAADARLPGLGDSRRPR